ncbi:DUF2254 domain-containing protein [Streptacidiphilus pinicola]|uniref:DUF2254 domain-containing protein n=1 Tax=Streptacidiphilus pinicola TaxID=2219663 RepID=A0A2X0J9T6_9ACTN|nr:DUF2254 domain-containing protein [Streptacidiphilus pinicola]RAG87056.1 DUF2254 domain-containing protein [Streptacidiphilus pinicola]
MFSRHGFRVHDWRRERLRTNLWVVPALEAAVAVVLFGATLKADWAAYQGHLRLPSWVLSGSADGARQVLSTIAAAIITVAGLVFSITIVALTLASTQFGPRMLRNFIRDRGTQLTLGTFVATFLYSVLVLVAVSPGPHGDFVPHLSVTVALALTLADLAMLIYFIHHIARAIQLPHVIADIAAELARAIETEGREDATGVGGRQRGLSPRELIERCATSAPVRTPASGYLQYLRHDRLIAIAHEANAVVHLLYRPGHFLVAGSPLARVWPAEAAPKVAAGLERGQVTGPYRTLTQDISFGIDQLVEIAIRALSPAVNDTFTALTCIDWLGECLGRIGPGWHSRRVHRDAEGYVRLIADQASYERLVQRSFEKIRQAGVGMPAVMIRQLDALIKVMERTEDPDRRALLVGQAELIAASCAASVPEAADREDVLRRHRVLLELAKTPGGEVGAVEGSVESEAATEPYFMPLPEPGGAR